MNLRTGTSCSFRGCWCCDGPRILGESLSHVVYLGPQGSLWVWAQLGRALQARLTHCFVEIFQGVSAGVQARARLLCCPYWLPSLASCFSWPARWLLFLEALGVECLSAKSLSESTRFQRWISLSSKLELNSFILGAPKERTMLRSFGGLSKSFGESLEQNWGSPSSSWFKKTIQVYLFSEV